jgi:hypothetical protein
LPSIGLRRASVYCTDEGTVVSLADATISCAVTGLPAMIANSAFPSAVCHQQSLVPALLATGAASSEVT